MVRMIMHGCNGAMGQVISAIVEKQEGISIVAGIDPADNKHNPYPVFSSLDACDVEADVIVDFASAKAVDGLLRYCGSTSDACGTLYHRDSARNSCSW